MERHPHEHHPDSNPAEDLAYEREVLDDSIRHDYSTSDTGIVPLDRRRPQWHFAGLWTTLVAGFSYMFLGFELHDGGHKLGSTIAITLLGYFLYIAYAMFGSYLGSRTGQTHALLTRSIFGVAGSWIVSAFVLVAPLGWVAFQANLLAVLWNGFYGWGIFTITLILAGVMIFNNLFGFTGISVFARYLVTPILIVWALYLVIKGFAADGGSMSGLHNVPKDAFALPFWVGIVAVIGFTMWGNEPDFWRYGKPRFIWPLPTYLFATVWFLLFTVGGWMMAQLSSDMGESGRYNYSVHYSLFGLFWLAFIIATISQFAINDGNYYESVNAGQNLIGGWRRWRRPFTCLAVAAGGVYAADLVNFHFLNGWFKVAAFLAVTVPCATVIMAVDHFLLPRIFRISRPLTRIPRWDEAGLINLPAVLALLGAVFFGVTGTASWPHGWLEKTPPNSWGPVPLEAWLIAGVGYVALVALARAIAPVRQALGFPKTVSDEQIASGAVINVAGEAERGQTPTFTPAPARGS